MLEATGRSAEAVDCQRQAVDILPGSAMAGSDLLVTLQYVDEADPAEV